MVVPSDKIAEVSEDIYQGYILPTIERASKGDELLFVSPSTFFGFYSRGARTYEDICQALKNAKRAGAQCRVLVDVGDVISATAARGLLNILDDGDELRTLGNQGTYFLLRYFAPDNGEFVAFNTLAERSIENLPDVHIRPFGDARGGPRAVIGSEARSLKEQFETLWKASQNERVIDAIIRCESRSFLQTRFESADAWSRVGFFIAGGVFGASVTVSKYEGFWLSWWALTAYIGGAVLVGVVANVATPFIRRRWLG